MDSSAFQQAKLSIVESLGLSKDALHIHVGLAVMLAAALVLRRPLSSPLPWVAALAAAVAGELWDAWDDLGTLGHLRMGAGAHDLLNTLVWPTVLLILARSGRFRLR